MVDQVRILCVDDEPNVLRSIERMFLDEEYDILTASSGEEGLEILCSNRNIQVILSDYRMPGMNGVDFLKEARKQRPETIRIVLSGYADTAAVVAAINEGQIYKFIPKPWNDDELKVTVAKAIETFNLHQENIKLSKQLRVKNEELEQLNTNLELLVADRTEELVSQNQALVHARNILQNLPFGVIALVPDGTIAQMNSVATVLLGQDAESCIGKKMPDVLPAEVRALVEKVLEEKTGSVSIALAGKKVFLSWITTAHNGEQAVILTLNGESRHE